MTQDADEVDGFRPVSDPQAALAWIPQDVREDGDVCGMDASGWEDDTWILHDLTVPIDPADREEGPRIRRRWRDVTDADLAVASKARGWPPNAMYLIRNLRWPDVEVEEGVFGGESLAALLGIVGEFSGPDIQVRASQRSKCRSCSETVPIFREGAGSKMSTRSRLRGARQERRM